MTGPIRRQQPVLGADAVRPPMVDAVFWAYLAAASLNAVIGVFLLSRSVDVVGPSRPAGLAVAGLVLVSFGYAAALIVLARRFRAGVGWARPALFMVSMLSLVAVAGPGLFVVLILALANVLAFTRRVSAWLRARAGLRPA